MKSAISDHVTTKVQDEVLSENDVDMIRNRWKIYSSYCPQDWRRHIRREIWESGLEGNLGRSTFWNCRDTLILCKILGDFVFLKILVRNFIQYFFVFNNLTFFFSTARIRLVFFGMLVSSQELLPLFVASETNVALYSLYHQSGLDFANYTDSDNDCRLTGYWTTHYNHEHQDSDSPQSIVLYLRLVASFPDYITQNIKNEQFDEI